MIFLAVVIISVGTSSLCVWYFQYRLKRRLGTVSLLAGLRKEIDKMIAEINKTTERSIILIENQVHSAKEEVRKIREFQQQQQQSENTTPEPSFPPASTMETTKQPEQTNPASEAGSERESPPPLTTEKQEPPVVPDIPLTPREKAVMLHRNGHSTSAIASELGMSLGEVELMISLHNRRH